MPQIGGKVIQHQGDGSFEFVLVLRLVKEIIGQDNVFCKTLLKTRTSYFKCNYYILKLKDFNKN